MSKNKYHVTYTVTPHPEGIAPEDVAPGQGAATALLIGSLLYPQDGSCSALFLSLDGRTGQDLSHEELWKAWTMMTSMLASSPTLSASKKAICQATFELIRDVILGNHAPAQSSPEG